MATLNWKVTRKIVKQVVLDVWNFYHSFIPLHQMQRPQEKIHTLRLCNTYTLLYLIPKRRCSGKHIFLRCLVTQYISEALRISIFKSKTQLLVAKSKKYTAKLFGENRIFQMSHKSCYLKAHQITLIRHKHTHKTTLT